MAETKASAMTLDDIVFENRNKAYGAYDLRKSYRPTLTKSMLIGGALFLLAMLSPALISLIPSQEQELNMSEVDLMKLPPPPIDPNEPPPPPPPPVELPKVATIKFLPPEVKKDEEERERIAHNGMIKVLHNYTQIQIVDNLIKKFEDWKTNNYDI